MDNSSEIVKTISMKSIETPIGTMVACATENGICMLEYGDRNTLRKGLEEISKSLNAIVVEQEDAMLAQLERELSKYFRGELKEFSVPVSPVGTDFQKKVWDSLQQIPYGSTMSYRDQAAALRNPLAVRAVANANGRNRISILIPCHRVIGASGQLTGYGGGLSRKQQLLDIERGEVARY